MTNTFITSFVNSSFVALFALWITFSILTDVSTGLVLKNMLLFILDLPRINYRWSIVSCHTIAIAYKDALRYVSIKSRLFVCFSSITLEVYHQRKELKLILLSFKIDL